MTDLKQKLLENKKTKSESQLSSVPATAVPQGQSGSLTLPQSNAPTAGTVVEPKRKDSHDVFHQLREELQPDYYDNLKSAELERLKSYEQDANNKQKALDDLDEKISSLQVSVSNIKDPKEAEAARSELETYQKTRESAARQVELANFYYDDAHKRVERLGFIEEGQKLLAPKKTILDTLKEQNPNYDYSDFYGTNLELLENTIKKYYDKATSGTLTDTDVYNANEIVRDLMESSLNSKDLVPVNQIKKAYAEQLIDIVGIYTEPEKAQDFITDLMAKTSSAGVSAISGLFNGLSWLVTGPIKIVSDFTSLGQEGMNKSDDDVLYDDKTHKLIISSKTSKNAAKIAKLKQKGELPSGLHGDLNVRGALPWSVEETLKKNGLTKKDLELYDIIHVASNFQTTLMRPLEEAYNLDSDEVRFLNNAFFSAGNMLGNILVASAAVAGFTGTLEGAMAGMGAGNAALDTFFKSGIGQVLSISGANTPNLISLGLSAFTSKLIQNTDEGNALFPSYLSALATGWKEVATERMFGTRWFGKGSLDTFTDAIIEALRKSVSNALGIVAEQAVEIAGEAIEEFVGDPIEKIIDRLTIYHGKEIDEPIFDFAKMAEEGASGAAVALIMLPFGISGVIRELRESAPEVTTAEKTRIINATIDMLPYGSRPEYLSMFASEEDIDAKLDEIKRKIYYIQEVALIDAYIKNGDSVFNDAAYESQLEYISENINDLSDKKLKLAIRSSRLNKEIAEGVSAKTGNIMQAVYARQIYDLYAAEGEKRFGSDTIVPESDYGNDDIADVANDLLADYRDLKSDIERNNRAVEENEIEQTPEKSDEGLSLPSVPAEPVVSGQTENVTPEQEAPAEEPAAPVENGQETAEQDRQVEEYMRTYPGMDKFTARLLSIIDNGDVGSLYEAAYKFEDLAEKYKGEGSSQQTALDMAKRYFEAAEDPQGYKDQILSQYKEKGAEVNEDQQRTDRGSEETVVTESGRAGQEEKDVSTVEQSAPFVERHAGKRGASEIALAERVSENQFGERLDLKKTLSSSERAEKAKSDGIETSGESENKGAYFSGYIYEPGANDSEAQAILKDAEKNGYTVVMVSGKVRITKTDDNGKVFETDVDGFIDRDTKTVILNVNKDSKFLFQTYLHETGHYSLYFDKSAVEYFYNLVKDKKGYAEMEKVYQKVYKAAGVPYDSLYIAEEIMCDARAGAKSYGTNATMFYKEAVSAFEKVEGTKTEGEVSESPVEGQTGNKQSRAPPVEDEETKPIKLAKVEADTAEAANVDEDKAKRFRENAAFGKEAKTFTNDGKGVGVVYAVVPVESLVASNDFYGGINKEYPAELQPRDRSRTTSRLQIDKISKNLRPELLTESPTAQNGSPIVRGDGVVIGGNGRTIAISAAYESGNASGYESYIREHAKDFGIEGELPDHPVLVRVVSDEGTNWLALSQDLNASTTNDYSATETAETDAKKARGIVDLLVANEEGELDTAENRPFIEAFIQQVVPESERGDMLTKKGALSKSGLGRINNALFFMAYEDTELSQQKSEEGSDITRVINALASVAPAVAAYNGMVNAEETYDVLLIDMVKEAIDILSTARAENKSVKNVISQIAIGREYSVEGSWLSTFFENNKSSGKQIRTFLNILLDTALSYGMPGQVGLLENAVTLKEVLERSIKQYESETGNIPKEQSDRRPDYKHGRGLEEIRGRTQRSGGEQSDASADYSDGGLGEVYQTDGREEQVKSSESEGQIGLSVDEDEVKTISLPEVKDNSDTVSDTSDDVNPISLTDVKAVEESGQDQIKLSISENNKIIDNAVNFGKEGHQVKGTNNQNHLDPKLVKRVSEQMNALADFLEKNSKDLKLPPDVIGNVLFGNQSYGKSAENTTECIRSIINGWFVADAERRLGRKLSIDEAVYVSQRTGEIMGNLQCLYCYVAADRLAYDLSLRGFLGERDTVFEMVKDGKSFDEIYQTVRNGRKDGKNEGIKSRVKYWYDEAKAGKTEGRLKESDLAGMKYSDESIKETRAKLKTKTQKYEFDLATAYAHSASHAKKIVPYHAYGGQILTMKQSLVNLLNREFGLRFYSYSDFSPAFILENMQMVMDAAVRGLKILAYTKDVTFARIFAGTGMNINISCYGEYVNGQWVFDEMQGAKIEEAKALREQYPNVGITFVVTDDVSKREAMKLDFVDVVLPYHSVFSGGGKIARLLGYTDYKSVQGEKKLREWSAGNAKEIFPPMHQNDIVLYAKACYENHLRPKFYSDLNLYDEFVTGKVSEKEFRAANPYYMKLVNETRQAANKSYPVQPRFSKEAMDVAYSALNEMKEQGGYGSLARTEEGLQYVVGDYADETAKNIQSGNFEINKSLASEALDMSFRASVSENQSSVTPEENARYMELARDPEKNEAELRKIVREVARRSGYDSPDLYHGTGRFGFTRFNTNAIFTITDLSVARGYNGGTGYLGDVRSTSSQYVNDDGTTETLIRNAKNVLGEDYHALTEKDKTERIRKDTEAIKEVAKKCGEFDENVIRSEWDAFWKKISGKYDEETSIEFENAFYGIAYMFGGWEENIDGIVDGNNVDMDYFRSDLNRYEDRRSKLRELYEDNIDLIKGTSLEPYFNYLLGYDFGDTFRDIEYGLGRITDERPKLVNQRGYIAFEDEVRDEVEMVKNVGIYHLLGNVGKNPLIVDAQGKYWSDIPFNGEYRTTDYIVKYAKNNGYTSAVIKNVLDPSHGGSANVAADEYVFFDSEQLKSADPVTYDDDGKVIPLTERFRTDRTGEDEWKNRDVRYSISMSDDQVNAAVNDLIEYLGKGDSFDNALNKAGIYHGEKGKRVSQFRTNTLKTFFDSVESQAEGLRLEDSSYDPISAKQSMDAALQRLLNDFDGEKARLEQTDAWGSTDLDAAMGILYAIRQEARLTGDYTEAARWTKIIRLKATRGGQFIQAFAKYNRTPIGIAVKSYEDIVDKNDIRNEYDKKRAKKISKEIETEVKEATKEAKEEDFSDIVKDYVIKMRGKMDKDAENLINEIFHALSDRDHGVPVEEWTSEAGARLAKIVSRNLYDKPSKQKTTMQTVLSDLIRYANEVVTPKGENPATRRTAIDRIRDFLNNRDAYARAWNDARRILRAQYRNDPAKLNALEDFLNGTITFNGSNTGFDKTVISAILIASEEIGLNPEKVRMLTAVNARGTAISKIAAKVVEEVGATGSDAVMLLDAVIRHINGISEQGDKMQRIRNSLIGKAAKKLQTKIENLIYESTLDREKAVKGIVDIITEELGIESIDAIPVAQTITDAVLEKIESISEKRLEKMFSEKENDGKVTKKEVDKLIKLIRLGGLRNASYEDAVVDALGLSRVSRAKQKEIFVALQSFADTLERMQEGDEEELRTLIKMQSEYRNIKVGRFTQKLLNGETDFNYLYKFAVEELRMIASDYNPRNLGEKISALQVISHLLNPRTGSRNVTSNQVFDLVSTAANNISLIPDMIMGLLTGTRGVGFEKSWILSKAKRQGAVAGAKRNALEVALDVNTEGDTRSKYGTKGRRTFSKATSGPVGRFFSTLEKLLGYELNTTDEFHKGSVNAATIESLARWVESGKMSPEEAAQAAYEEALYRSFQDDTAAGKFLEGLKTVLNVVGFGDANKQKARTLQKGKIIKDKRLPRHSFGLGDLTIKYTQVPGALIHRAIEFSPVGYLKAIYNIGLLVYGKKTGNFRDGVTLSLQQRKAALDIGRATTGTGLILAFAALAKLGLLRVQGDDDDKDKAALESSEGMSDTQLNLSALGRVLSGGSSKWEKGDVLVNIGFLEPLDTLMTIGALIGGEEEINLANVSKDAIGGIVLAFRDTSAMQTISNIYNTIYYHKDENGGKPGEIAEVLLEIASSSVSGFIPAPIRQLAQATDTVYREQYGTQDIFSQILSKVMNSVPGLRQMLNPKLTGLGDAKKYENPYLNALNALVLPGNVNTYRPHDATKIFEEVSVAADDIEVYPDRSAPYYLKINNEKNYLTGDERNAYQATRGTLYEALALGMANSSTWDTMTDEAKANALKKAKRYANYVATKAYSDENGIPYSNENYDYLNDLDGDMLITAIAGDLSETKVASLKALENTGADTDAYVDAVTSNPGGLKNQSQINAYIDGLNDLTDDEKAILWQALASNNGTTSTANNPYILGDEDRKAAASQFVDEKKAVRADNASQGTTAPVKTEPQSLEEAIEALTPENGASHVSNKQKWNTVKEWKGTDDPTAYKPYMSTKEYTAVKNSIDKNYFTMDDYLSLENTVDNYDADGSGSFKQPEITAAIEGEFGDRSAEFRAIMWQAFAYANNSTTSTKNNPYVKSGQVSSDIVNKYINEVIGYVKEGGLALPYVDDDMYGSRLSSGEEPQALSLPYVI